MHRVKQNSASYCQSDVAWARTLVNSILSVICPHARIVVLGARHTCQTMHFACWTMRILHAMQTWILRARQCILRAGQRIVRARQCILRACWTMHFAGQCILRARQRISRARRADMHFACQECILRAGQCILRARRGGHAFACQRIHFACQAMHFACWTMHSLCQTMHSVF